MKRLISAALALSLLGATAASAAPVNHGTQVQYRDSYRRHDDNGAAVAAGIGFIALAAILASQNNRDRDDYRDRSWDHRDYGYDRGYSNSYRGYDRNYGNGYYNNGYGQRGW